MSKGKYILVDGTFVSTEEYQISLVESGAIHFTEKIRAIRTSFPFFKETLDLIRFKLFLYNQSFPEFTENDGSALRRQLERTLTKNKHYLGAILTLTLRFSEQKIQFTIQSEKTDQVGYELNEKGLYTEIFEPIKKSISSLSHLSLGSEIFWDIAKSHQKESTTDELLLVNTSDQIIETYESNIYLIKGKTAKGAGSEQGAYQDITKPLMLDVFKKLKLDYAENEGITKSDLYEADELLIVNSIKGIRWVLGFENKRYFNHTIRKITDLFNQLIFS